MGLPLQIFHAERCVRQYAPGWRGAAPRAAQSSPACKEIRSHPVHGLQHSPDLLEASLARAPGVIVGAFGRVCRALHPSRLVRGRFLAALVPVVGLLDLVAFLILSRLEPADRPVAADVAGVSTLGLATVRGETGACALPGAAALGVSPCLLLSPCWLSSQPPSEPAASWKGSSMRARMTPTPEAPGRWRQVVCSCEGPPVRVPMPLKATRPRSSAM